MCIFPQNVILTLNKKKMHFFFYFVLQCLNDNKKLFYTMGTVVKTQQQGYIITSRKSFHD